MKYEILGGFRAGMDFGADSFLDVIHGYQSDFKP